jgi:hypothetical protein
VGEEITTQVKKWSRQYGYQQYEISIDIAGYPDSSGGDRDGLHAERESVPDSVLLFMILRHS